jgi:hypothetical protein
MRLDTKEIGSRQVAARLCTRVIGYRQEGRLGIKEVKYRQVKR